MSDTMSAEAFAEMRKPGEQHRLMQPMVGTFHSEVKMWMGPGEPTVMTGTMVNAMELGGLFLSNTYTGDAVDGPFPAFEGRGYFGFNKATGRFEGVWIDNASSVMQTEVGDVDESGKVWKMEGEMIDPGSGKKMLKRSIVTIDDDDRHRMEMFFVQGDQEFKGMEINYVRQR